MKVTTCYVGVKRIACMAIWWNLVGRLWAAYDNQREKENTRKTLSIDF
jgi:hypothetical protein